jgi:Big-like domain-containing protein
VQARQVRRNRRIRLVPGSPLAAGTAYTVQLTGLRDVAGNGLAALVVTGFTTGAEPDFVSPAMVGVNPPKGAVDVALNTVVRLIFSEAPTMRHETRRDARSLVTFLAERRKPKDDAVKQRVDVARRERVHGHTSEHAPRRYGAW